MNSRSGISVRCGKIVGLRMFHKNMDSAALLKSHFLAPVDLYCENSVTCSYCLAWAGELVLLVGL